MSGIFFKDFTPLCPFENIVGPFSGLSLSYSGCMWHPGKGCMCARIIFRTKLLIGKSMVSLIMDILGSVVGIILAIVVAVIIYFLLKNVIALVVNAIVGVIVLFLLNLFHIMSLFGASDLPIDWITILVSAIGGFVGVVIVVILHLAGVVL
jgi:hypothetical protein